MAGGSASEPLLERAHGQGEVGSSGTQQQILASHEAQARLEAGAQRVVMWTVWLLLGAVMLGTVIGVVLVSEPMQRGDPPPAVRKSPAVVVLRPATQEGNLSSAPLASNWHRHLLQRAHGGNATFNSTKILVWSGKGHGKNLVFDDLYMLDVATKRWATLFSMTAEEGKNLQYPVPRWKAVTLYDAKRKEMVLFGGDPLGAAGIGKVYLDDLWRLQAATPFSKPVWQSVNVSGGDSLGARPAARRAHAGIIAEVNGTSTLVIHGGRLKHDGVLTDVWAAPLESEATEWSCLSACGDDELSKKKRKKKKKKGGSTEKGPAPRKGHVAFAVPGEDGTKLVIWGGRNDTVYFRDLWAFDLASGEWEQWGMNSSKVPSGRDHLGGFYADGNLFIYGGRGGADWKSSIALGDVWCFDIKEQQWSQREAKGPQPPARFLYGMDVYAAAEGDTRLVVFGGEAAGKAYLNDVWCYSTARNTWEELAKGVVDRKEKKQAKP